MAVLTLLQENCIHVLLEPQDQLLEFGRQDFDEPPPFAIRSIGNGQRIIISETQNTKVARRQLRLERIDSNRVRLTNIHKSLGVILDSHILAASATRETVLPAKLQLGNIQLRIEVEGTNDNYHTLGEQSGHGLVSGLDPGSLPISLIATLKRGDHRSLLHRMKQLVEVLQASASSANFMDRVANVSVELLELDHAAVVLWKDKSFEIVASAQARQSQEDEEWRPSQSLLNRVRSSRLTTWSSPEQLSEPSSEISLRNVVAYVAAPIKNPQGEVIGAVYGDRRTGFDVLRQPIGEIDGHFVEILACGIAGGLQRLASEREVLARRLQFEQFVTAEVARQIEEDPESLTGRDADVTILFCDIAGFSRVSEQLSPRQTFEWINDVMTVLSECVTQHGGTIVDYVGDELIAMWGAPFPNENHAKDACRAAIAMIQSLPKIDAKWHSIVSTQTQVGIGLNSGMVRVGNTGCQLKLKYGPLGSTVNIASRIQGATRFLRTPILITGDTAKLLSEEFTTRRLCQVRVKNIETPIDIHELFIAPPENWAAQCSDYALALAAWEEGNLQESVKRLVQIVANCEKDVPAKVMLSRAIDVWSRDQAQHDPIWTLPSK